MTADFPIVLDACVLANFGLCDLFLRLAEPPRLYVPRWSDVILDEVRRTQLRKLKPPWPEARADSWRREVVRAFPEACVRGWESLVTAMPNDEGDRHVLAAAVYAGVSVIVTFNQRHFPTPLLQPLGVAAVHPQDYLLTLYAMSPGVVLTKLADIASDRREEVQDILIHLGKSVPSFSRRLLEDSRKCHG
jgi:hypothetical protein